MWTGFIWIPALRSRELDKWILDSIIGGKFVRIWTTVQFLRLLLWVTSLSSLVGGYRLFRRNMLHLFARGEREKERECVFPVSRRGRAHCRSFWVPKSERSVTNPLYISRFHFRFYLSPSLVSSLSIIAYITSRGTHNNLLARGFGSVWIWITCFWRYT
jgi:hypothetical protein